MLVSLLVLSRGTRMRLLTLAAVVWDDDQIAVYFFARGSIPNDLLADAPLPDTWGTPMARWPSTNCDTSKFFKNHSIIIDTTLWYDLLINFGILF